MDARRFTNSRKAVRELGEQEEGSRTPKMETIKGEPDRGPGEGKGRVSAWPSWWSGVHLGQREKPSLGTGR